MASEWVLSGIDDVQQIAGYVCDYFELSEYENPPPLRVQITKKNNGTLPMLKLWRMWMADIAKFQVRRGATIPILAPQTNANGVIEWKAIGERPYNENDAHEAYTYLLLGCDERGVRYSWAVHTDNYEGRKVASLSRKLHAMQKFHQFCIEHSIPIRIPERSEYQELQDKQNGIKHD
ncbi:hypothetical protein NU208_001226 [Vibrio parahaemolyticus]|nr:hypothetical protein [Vibrio parahaemolyticus]EHH2497239.1 hypothetical protein [Vibrio parahaemolyticus]EID4329005.1 hypothetical protein [Vibrio parahaemolyticus]EJP3274105.1 hypothetical protein [Vibrio parahaemolyticus]ELA9444340.1 hypothetical protein [Vibrio parahaemolyticus]